MNPRIQTIVQLLEAEDETLTNNIRSSPILLSLIKQLAAAGPGSQDGSPRQGSISDEDDGGSTGESGAGEIAALARRILDLTDGGSVTEGLADGRPGEQFEAFRHAGKPTLMFADQVLSVCRGVVDTLDDFSTYRSSSFMTRSSSVIPPSAWIG